MKTCSICKIEKSLELFNKSPDIKSGYKSTCKACRNSAARLKNINPADIKDKKCSRCNLIKLPEEFYLLKRNKDGYTNNCKTCVNKKRQEQYIKHKERIKQRSALYYLKNKTLVISKQLERQKERLKTDDFYKLQRNLRNRLYYALKNKEWRKNTHFTEYIGCEREILISHIELQFQSGMTWDNYGLWEIDHIKPLANASTEEELYNLCHYTNFQPLWKLDNVKKSNN